MSGESQIVCVRLEGKEGSNQTIQFDRRIFPSLSSHTHLRRVRFGDFLTYEQGDNFIY